MRRGPWLRSRPYRPCSTPGLIDLILLGRNQWTGKGKWGPRLLRRFDPALADLATKAFAEAVQGQTAALLSLTEQVLDQHGGRYLDGYHVDAPLHARISANPLT